ncbi:hypothetical protein FJT64_015595 [Amphibalanus amphitrite]|uniref:Uncharacterized protein n=1 Tax=Amphibalanus amphitrite TaxID=1232801 RepID=A0A6A4X2H4_AMPAM|nr:hypothetical protein FJT64_015595 [Amphibalanus amphitrite]
MQKVITSCTLGQQRSSSEPVTQSPAKPLDLEEQEALGEELMVGLEDLEALEGLEVDSLEDTEEPQEDLEEEQEDLEEEQEDLEEFWVADLVALEEPHLPVAIREQLVTSLEDFSEERPRDPPTVTSFRAHLPVEE